MQKSHYSIIEHNWDMPHVEALQALEHINDILIGTDIKQIRDWRHVADRDR